MEKQKNLPVLRFPEYTGVWEKKRLRELTTLITKGTTPSKFTESGIKFIKIECFLGDKIITEKCLFIDEKTHNKELRRSILNEGDILFAIAGATIGKCSIVTKEILPANTNQALSLIRLNENENKLFVYHCLKSDKMRKYIIDTISVGAQPNLNLEQMGNFSFSLPPTLSEQTKIATFLTAVDDRLNQLKQKKTLLEQYKKGVVQKLFDQEIRFKDEVGNDFPDSGKHEIGSFVDFLSGYPFNGEDISEDSIGVPLMRGINITEGSIRHSKEIDKYYCGDTRKIEKYFLNEADLVIGMDGSKVGKNSALIDSKNANSILVQRVARLRQKENSSIRFIYQHINSSRFHKYVDEVKTSSGIPHISASQIKEFKISFPCLPEQIKIANFLSAIDKKINCCTDQISKTEQYKKGLLQQMFV